jgi:hypothetical protein
MRKRRPKLGYLEKPHDDSLARVFRIAFAGFLVLCGALVAIAYFANKSVFG